MNQLFHGDNLEILRRHVEDESVDLIYLDPPFKTNQDLVVQEAFCEHEPAMSGDSLRHGGKKPKSSPRIPRKPVTAFKDIWTWDQAAAEDYRTVVRAGGRIALALKAFRQLVGTGDRLAYLTMMAPRLAELHRIMKPTATLYLHCDPTAGSFLRLLLDAVFGPRNFRTEIVWKRISAHNDTKQGRRQYGRAHDLIYCYTKGDRWTWNPIYVPYDREHLTRTYRHVEEKTGRRYSLGDLTGPGGSSNGNPLYEVMGVTRYWRYSEEKMAELIRQGRVVQTRPGAVPLQKRYLDEMQGVPAQDVWTDINPVGAHAAERVGYPTQKPEALLDRIIRASSNTGDLVLDPFCGCGTTLVVAERLGRKWIGIDASAPAVTLIRGRLKAAFGPKYSRLKVKTV